MPPPCCTVIFRTAKGFDGEARYNPFSLCPARFLGNSATLWVAANSAQSPPNPMKFIAARCKSPQAAAHPLWAPALSCHCPPVCQHTPSWESLPPRAGLLFPDVETTSLPGISVRYGFSAKRRTVFKPRTDSAVWLTDKAAHSHDFVWFHL